jgi:O-methyltransferase domain
MGDRGEDERSAPERESEARGQAADATDALVREASDLADFWTPIALRTIVTVGALDAFAAGPRSPYEVAADVGVDGPTLHRVVRALAGRGVFVEDADGGFGLTELGRLFCLDHPRSLAGRLGWKSWEVHGWAEFEQTLRTGEPGFVHHFGTPYWEWLAAHPEASARFDRMMELRSSTFLRSVRPLLGRLPSEGVIIDVGGGKGTLVAVVLDAIPGLRGVVFDRPQVISSAGPVLDAAGVAARVELIGGDFLASVPAGGDVYTLASILHDWDDADAVRILRNVRAAMEPGAVLIILDAILREANEWDPFKLMDLHMLVLFGAGERDEAQWRHLLGSAGFAMTEAIRSPGLAWIEAVPTGPRRG